MQHDAPDIIQLSQVLAITSQRLALAHMAYAEEKFTDQHRTDTYTAAQNMGMLLAEFEDDRYGRAYHLLSDDAGWDMRRAMRHLEQAASALIAAIHYQDDVRGVFEPEKEAA